MVPTKEMPDVFKVLKEFDRTSLRPKMWVRLKKGVFKDDLAQVGMYFSVFLCNDKDCRQRYTKTVFYHWSFFAARNQS